MIKLNLKKMMEENHKGTKVDRKIISADGYLVNGYIGVKVGLDKVADRMFKDAKVEEGFKLLNIACAKKCEYTVTNIEEKARITRITGKYTSTYDEITGVIYFNSEYYRFMKKHKLEIKIHPDSHTMVGLKDGEIVALALGIRYGSNTDDAIRMFNEEQSVEEFLKEKQEEKEEKEKIKKMQQEFAEKTAREELIRMRIQSNILELVAGKECRITKDGKKYLLECYTEGRNKELMWCAFCNLSHLSSKLSEQKMIGEKILETINSNIEGFLEEVDAIVKEKELAVETNKSNLEELEEIKKDLVEFGAVHPAFKVGVYGTIDNGFRLEVEGLGHFLRMKVGYTLENVLRSMDGHKEIIEGSKEEIIEKLKSTIEPDIKEYQEFLKKKEIVKELFSTTGTLLEKREDGYRIIDLDTKTIDKVNRGKLNKFIKRDRDCIIEYVIDKAKEICVFDLEKDKLTKKDLDKKEMINISEYLNKQLAGETDISADEVEKKEIKISIDGEGRVEKIETNSLKDADSNLLRRVKEVTSGDAYCNKTWITIDIKEFEEPIEFRVDLINRLHHNTEGVLQLIIEEKERECKYMEENAERCTWIKDKEKFVSIRRKIIKVLESYLLPEPEIKVEEGEVNTMATITKQQLTNRMKKMGNQLINTTTAGEREKIVETTFPKACEIDVTGDTIHFVVGEEYTGARPTDKFMKQVDENFREINNMYGLTIYIDIRKNEIKIYANTAIEYIDIWGNEGHTDFEVKTIDIEIPMTDAKAVKIVTNTVRDYKDKKITLDKALRSMYELSQIEGLNEDVIRAIKETKEYFDGELELEKETNENNRAKEMIQKINKAFTEGRVDAPRCIDNITHKIENSIYQSTKELYKPELKRYNDLHKEKNKKEESSLLQNVKKRLEDIAIDTKHEEGCYTYTLDNNCKLLLFTNYENEDNINLKIYDGHGNFYKKKTGMRFISEYVYLIKVEEVEPEIGDIIEGVNVLKTSFGQRGVVKEKTITTAGTRIAIVEMDNGEEKILDYSELKIIKHKE